MTILYILAHQDDEFGAMPLIEEAVRAGERQVFAYLTDSGGGEVFPVRKAETLAFFRGVGLDAPECVFVGDELGIPDLQLYRHAERALERLRQVAAAVGPVTRIVTMGWEGGHSDHDVCAGLAVALAGELPQAPTLDQLALYHGRGLPGPLFRSFDPIPENGPTRRARIGPAGWLRLTTAVRHYPSQWKTWLGLWPTMMLTFVLRGGYHYQALDRRRVRERPHAGPLYYERRFGIAYADVRAAIDPLLKG